jgi:hypothetical protein
MSGMIDKLIGVYTKTDQVMAGVAKEKPNKQMLVAHAALNAVILNLFIALAFISVPVLSVIYLVVLSAFTALAIMGIEFVTHMAAKSKGGKGSYWQQLAITNLYLTPLFSVFFLLAALVMLIFPSGNPSLPLDVAIGIVASLMNRKKIMAVHNIKDSLPDIAYVLGMAVAYVIWIIIVIVPVMLLAGP